MPSGDYYGEWPTSQESAASPVSVSVTDAETTMISCESEPTA